MKINHLLSLSKAQTTNKNTSEISSQNNNSKQSISTSVGLRSKFNDHKLAFKGQVDKGLQRFYNANKDRMPSTVRRYTESLEDKSRLTPLEAQQRAYNKLINAQSAEDIKKSFPDEQLFSELKNPQESKATRGLLSSARENKELFELYDIDILKDKKNLTVYLVQKIFLEGKTIDEINTDLENDLNEDFKADFKAKNQNSKYIYGSTLKSLGILTPSFEYQQSLRFTRDGYSDEVGGKIQKSLRAFWDTMPDEERTARNKKSVQNFENWWDSYTTRQKLEMIANDEKELEMLKEYKKVVRAEKKNNPSQSQEEVKPDTTKRKHHKVGSEKLSKDELFKKWAANKLKLFEASLSEAEKDTLHIKRMQKLASRWSNMSYAEKTDYINKMKSGSAPLKFTMIDAWNHNIDLIKDLSLHLRANQIYKPADLLYSSEQFSEFQSNIMNEFWQTHPHYAEKLGNSIIESQQKVQAAVSRGTFEELQKQIMRDKHQRIKELEKFKAANPKPAPVQLDDSTPQYIKEFKTHYLRQMSARLHNIPQEYLDEYFKSIQDLPQEYIISWTKNLKGETLTPKDVENLNNLMSAEYELTAFEQNRAIEAALSSVLFEYTKNPDVYTLSHSDVKTAIYKLETGENPIQFHSTKLRKDFILPVKKDKVNINKNSIDNLYHIYRQPLNDSEIDDIIRYYFTVEYTPENKSNPDFDKKIQETKAKLAAYIKKYNKSALIIFSDKTTFPPNVKDAFYKKFIANMPSDEILTGPIKPLIKSVKDFEYEEKIKTARFHYKKKFDFLPSSFVDSYFREISKQLREQKEKLPVDYFISTVCKKRKNSVEHGKVMLFEKQHLSMENKLYSLAMEQALADILYESTENPQVFSLGLETLCDNLEVLSLAKKFPTGEKLCPASMENEQMIIVGKKKPNLYKAQKLYKEYVQQIREWTDEIAQENTKPDWEDLLYILNPEENNMTKDIAIAKRMARYGVAPEKIAIYPNGQMPE